jgi:hypothetical protein
MRPLRAAHAAEPEAAIQNFHLLGSIGMATALSPASTRKPLAMSVEFNAVAGYILVISAFGVVPCE